MNTPEQHLKLLKELQRQNKFQFDMFETNFKHYDKIHKSLTKKIKELLKE